MPSDYHNAKNHNRLSNTNGGNVGGHAVVTEALIQLEKASRPLQLGPLTAREQLASE